MVLFKVVLCARGHIVGRNGIGSDFATRAIQVKARITLSFSVDPSPRDFLIAEYGE
jgi:hypothetical protein